jgi:hypothetical protein
MIPSGQDLVLMPSCGRRWKCKRRKEGRRGRRGERKRGDSVLGGGETETDIHITGTKYPSKAWR